jgi:hypothetical protein
MIRKLKPLKQILTENPSHDFDRLAGIFFKETMPAIEQSMFDLFGEGVDVEQGNIMLIFL